MADDGFTILIKSTDGEPLTTVTIPDTLQAELATLGVSEEDLDEWAPQALKAKLERLPPDHRYRQKESVAELLGNDDLVEAAFRDALRREQLPDTSVSEWRFDS